MDYNDRHLPPGGDGKLSVELTLSKMSSGRTPKRCSGSTTRRSGGPRRRRRSAERQSLQEDRHGHVGRVYQRASRAHQDERAALYRKERIRLSTRATPGSIRCRLPECGHVPRRVDYLDPLRKVDYQQLWRDVRECIDEAQPRRLVEERVKADLARSSSTTPIWRTYRCTSFSSGRSCSSSPTPSGHKPTAVMRHPRRAALGLRVVAQLLRHRGGGRGKPGFFTERGSSRTRRAERQDHQARSSRERGPLPWPHLPGGNLPTSRRWPARRGERPLHRRSHLRRHLRAKKHSVFPPP